MEKNLEKLSEKYSREFLEYSGLKLSDYLRQHGYGEVIHIACNIDTDKEQNIKNMTFHVTVNYCKNIDAIIAHSVRILEAKFIRMLNVDYDEYEPNFIIRQMKYNNKNCNEFIFDKYL